MTALYGADSETLPGDGPEGQARAFLGGISVRFGLAVDPADLRLNRIDHDRLGDHVRFQQTVQGSAVVGDEVDVHIQDGKAYLVTSSCRAIRMRSPGPALTSDQALSRSPFRAGRAGAMEPDGPPELVVWPRVEPAIWAWKFPARDSRGLPYALLLDAGNDRVLQAAPRFQAFSAPVYVENPTTTPVREIRDLTNLNGSGLLEGPFADVRLHGAFGLRGPKGDQLKAGGDGFHFAPGDGRSAQVNAFYQINRIHDFYKALGVDGIDYQIPVLLLYHDTKGEAYLNAFYDPTNGKSGSLAIGEGPKGEDFGLDASVLYHEYTHFVVQQINPDLAQSQTMETAALNEALADYGAATVTGDPDMAGFISPLVAGRPYLRDLTSRRHYPEDTGTNDARDAQGRYVGFTEIHDLGEVISGSLWDLRNLIGAAETDRIVLASLPLMDGSTSFPEVRVALLEADAKLNGGAHADAMQGGWDARGIATKPARYLAPGAFFSLSGLSFTEVWIGPMAPDPVSKVMTVSPTEIGETFVVGRTYPLSGIISDEKATQVTLKVSDLKGNEIAELRQDQDVSKNKAVSDLDDLPGRSFDFPLDFPAKLAGQTVGVSLTYKISGADSTASAWAYIVPEPGPSVAPVAEPQRVPARLLGDANGDGKISVADGIAALRVALGLDPADLPRALLLDVAPSHADGTVGDDAVTLLDAVALLTRAVAR